LTPDGFSQSRQKALLAHLPGKWELLEGGRFWPLEPNRSNFLKLGLKLSLYQGDLSTGVYGFGSPRRETALQAFQAFRLPASERGSQLLQPGGFSQSQKTPLP
jgi:hypothetical protein